MERELVPHITVPRSRLAAGTWEGDRETGEGDIHASYSADVIAMNGKVRMPFRHGAYLWTCISIRSLGPELEAYRLTPLTMFDGTVTTYGEKVHRDGGERARADANGFYHGMKVQQGGNFYVLTGPPCLFVADSEDTAVSIPQQMDLFGSEVRP